jgi:hypothetical protein
MVIFNDPVPVENPALQAVLMALDMRSAIGALIERWRILGHDLGYGIGIAHGFASLGTIGFGGVEHLTNLAARNEAAPMVPSLTRRDSKGGAKGSRFSPSGTSPWRCSQTHVLSIQTELMSVSAPSGDLETSN